MAEISSVTMLNSALWWNRLTKCSSIIKLLKRDLIVHLQISGTHKFSRGNTSHCIFIRMPKSGCLCREGCRSALLHFQHRILTLTPLAYSRFILGHLGGTISSATFELASNAGCVCSRISPSTDSPKWRRLPEQQMAVLSSHALSTEGNSLGFTDKNSSSFKVGLC